MPYDPLADWNKYKDQWSNRGGSAGQQQQWLSSEQHRMADAPGGSAWGQAGNISSYNPSQGWSMSAAAPIAGDINPPPVNTPNTTQIVPNPVAPTTNTPNPIAPIGGTTSVAAPVAPNTPPIQPSIPTPPIAGTTVANPTVNPTSIPPPTSATPALANLPQTSLIANRKKLSSFGGV